MIEETSGPRKPNRVASQVEFDSKNGFESDPKSQQFARRVKPRRGEGVEQGGVQIPRLKSICTPSRWRVSPEAPPALSRPDLNKKEGEVS